MSKTENFGKPEAGEMRKLTLDVADLSSDQFLEITRICGLDVEKGKLVLRPNSEQLETLKALFDAGFADGSITLE